MGEGYPQLSLVQKARILRSDIAYIPQLNPKEINSLSEELSIRQRDARKIMSRGSRGSITQKTTIRKSGNLVSINPTITSRSTHSRNLKNSSAYKKFPIPPIWSS